MGLAVRPGVKDCTHTHDSDSQTNPEQDAPAIGKAEATQIPEQ